MDSASPAGEQTRALMTRQVTQLVRLVDDLMDVNRIRTGKIELHRERVALATIVRSALESCQPALESAGHVLAVTLPEESVWLDADPTRLVQVFVNLLNNAIKYTAPGGHIALSAERSRAEVRVAVKDSGMGIPIESLAGIFDMFAQIDPARANSQGGLGVGLSLVKRLVELHGGEVSANSRGPGTGSEFVVRLPITEPA